MKHFLISLFCLFFLSACATNEKIVIKDKVVYVLAEPPSALYQKEKRIKPPDTQQYVESSWEEKEELLFDYVEKLNNQISSLFKDRQSIEKWIEKQKVLIKEKERDK